MNRCQQGFYSVASFGFGGQESASKPPQAICRTLCLTPERYIDFKEVADDGQAFDEKMQILTSTLSKKMQKANKLDEAIKVDLEKIGFTI